MEDSYKSYSANIPDSNGSHRGEGREGTTVCAVYVGDDVISGMSQNFPSASSSSAHLLAVANVGDSRCVLGQVGGRAIPMSFDHEPTDAAERARLKDEGFTVVRGRIYDKSTGKGEDSGGDAFVNLIFV